MPNGGMPAERQAATRSPKDSGAHATAPSPKSNACLGIRLPDERAVDPRHQPVPTISPALMADPRDIGPVT
jgi:hypothetical protein